MEIIFVLGIAAAAYWWGKRSKNKVAKRGGAPPSERDEEEGNLDHFEGWFYKGHDPRQVSAHLEIRYRDANGNKTSRKIHVRQFDPSLSGGMMLAHCYLREASRSFRIDRVKSCVDTETGEVIKDVGAHLERLYSTAPERVLELLERDYRDIIRVLGFMAMADGDFADSEKVVIAEYVCKLTRDDRVTSAVVAEACKRIGKTSMHGFKAAVGRVINSGGVSPVLLAGCCRHIAEADGAVIPEEQEALDYLDRRIMDVPVT